VTDAKASPEPVVGDQQYWRSKGANERRTAGTQEFRIALPQRGANNDEIVSARSGGALDRGLRLGMSYGDAFDGHAAALSAPPRINENR
jgi:hypothetical protein